MYILYDGLKLHHFLLLGWGIKAFYITSVSLWTLLVAYIIIQKIPVQRLCQANFHHPSLMCDAALPLLFVCVCIPPLHSALTCADVTVRGETMWGRETEKHWMSHPSRPRKALHLRPAHPPSSLHSSFLVLLHWPTQLLSLIQWIDRRGIQSCNELHDHTFDSVWYTFLLLTFLLSSNRQALCV